MQQAGMQQAGMQQAGMRQAAAMAGPSGAAAGAAGLSMREGRLEPSPHPPGTPSCRRRRLGDARRARG